MAETFDPTSFINALNQLTDATEKAALAEMGVARNEEGKLTALETRLEIENKINKALRDTYSEKEFNERRSATLFKKSLGSLGYIVDETGKIAKAIGSAEMTVAQKRQIARLTELDRKQKETVEAQVNLGRNIKQGAVDFGKTMAGFGADLARGNTGFTTLNPLIDAVAKTLSNLALAIPFFGKTISAVAKGLAEGSKFILELTQKNLQVFQELSSGGAIFSNGMSGVNQTFLDAGLSMAGLTKVIQKNGETLSRYGGTIAGGAIKFSGAIGLLTKGQGSFKEAGEGLRNLGLTADDIGERAAAFLEQEIRLGRGRSMNAEQLARGTVSYTKELLALQKVTGKSREQLEDEKRKILNMGRFRATTDEMRDNGGALAAEEALAFMTRLPEEMKAGFEETLSGAGGANYGTFVQSFGQEGVDLVNKLKEAKTKDEVAIARAELEKMLPILAARTVERMQQAGKATTELGTYSFASMSDMKKGLGVYGEAQAGVNAAAATTDPLTKSATVAQQNLEKISRRMFEVGSGLFPLAADAVERFSSTLIEAIDGIKDLFGKNSGSKKSGKQKVNSASTAASTYGSYQKPPNGAGPGGSQLQPDPANQQGSTPAQSSSSAPAQGPTSARYKEGAEKHGVSTDPLYAMVDQVHALLGNDYKYFSGLKDRDSGDSKHVSGEAFDLVLKDGSHSNYETVLPKIKALAGITFAQFEKDGQQNFKNGKPTSKARGDHIHAEVSAKYGGIASGPQTGFPAMLHGPKEAIIPLATDSILEKMAKTPASAFANSTSSNTSDSMIISMLSDKFDAMINLLSNGNDIQDQLLRHSRI